MHHWDRNIAGRLERSSAPQEQSCELSIHDGQMEPPPEEQQSQHGVHRNPNAYRSMRDHIHPPRVSSPSFIVPPPEDTIIMPYIVPLLLTFHGMESENPYLHNREFEEVCNTFKDEISNVDMMRLKFFPLTLKDNAKIWLNSLRLRTIRNWGDMQVEFLKKFFSTHKTNNLKRQIYTFAAQENEKFYQCWERYPETINAYPHHGFDTWMLVNHFYNGMSPAMKQLLETMCGGDFMSKHPEEDMDFLNYVAKTSKAWDERNPREAKWVRLVANQREGIHSLPKYMEMKEKMSTLARRLEELEMRNQHEVRAVAEAPVHIQPCLIFQSTNHQGEHFLTAPSVMDLMVELANVVGQYKPPTNSQYNNTYNPKWRYHHNLS